MFRIFSGIEATSGLPPFRSFVYFICRFMFYCHFQCLPNSFIIENMRSIIISDILYVVPLLSRKFIIFHFKRIPRYFNLDRCEPVNFTVFSLQSSPILCVRISTGKHLSCSLELVRFQTVKCRPHY